MFKMFYPTWTVESVHVLTPNRLKEWKIESILCDIDCTLKLYRESKISSETQNWLDSLAQSGIGICLLSNGLEKRISKFATSLNLPWIAQAMKPSPRGCLKAMEQMQFDPAKTAMVGDQIFADILAGRRAGIQTILVRPMSPEQEPWFARLKRPFERLVLAEYQRQNQSKLK